MPQAQSVSNPPKWPLISTLSNRDNTLARDARMGNAYVELDPQTQEFQIRKRIGLGPPEFSFTAGVGLGMYTWVKTPFDVSVITIIAGSVYIGSTLLGTVSFVGNQFQFQQINGSPRLLVFGDGRHSYYTNGTAITTISDPNFPGNMLSKTLVPGWAYLNGILYAMTDDGYIYNTLNPDDPSTWDPAGIIRARVEPDPAVRLAKNLVYVVALKQWTTEIFYDAGNSPGSPLQSLPGGLLTYGCVHANTVQDTEGTLIWVTSNRTVSPQVVRMDNLQVKVISTPPVERLLLGSNAQSNFYSFVLRHAGHRWYVLTSTTTNITLVYDMDQDLWMTWYDANGNYFPIISQAFDITGNHLLQHETNGLVYLTGPDYQYASDNGSVAPVDIYTKNFDSGVAVTKFLKSLYIQGDQTAGNVVKVRWSDDDYQTWSNFVEVDISVDRPQLDDLGSFYRRALHIQHQKNLPLRLRSVSFKEDFGVL